MGMSLDYSNTVHSKVMFEHVCNTCKTCLKHVQDTSGMRTRRYRASTKPRDKAAVRCTWKLRPFFARRGCNQNTCRTHPECVRHMSEMCAGCLWDMCECYLGAELHCITTLCFAYSSSNTSRIPSKERYNAVVLHIGIMEVRDFLP